MGKQLNVVWLKRDLRTTDHKALYEAEKLGQDYIVVYLFEPKQMSHPDYSLRHQQFIYHSLLAMNDTLQAYNRKVHIFHTDADTFFEYLASKYSVSNVFSYQESGTDNSWDRDKKVAQLFKDKKVNWQEFENQAVIRGSKNRSGWDKHWFIYASSPIIQNTYVSNQYELEQTPFDFNTENFPTLKKYPKHYQPAGEQFAFKYLNSFIKDRGKNYNRHISQPEKSRYSCGRISTYLAWGNISVRQVYQKVKLSNNYKTNKRAFDSFLSRIKWRSHFIQKFEVDCSYEHSCINRGYEQMEYANDNVLLEKWKNGQTGFPMVDASMRCLIHNGWLNFRMRAMLVSFLCHYLEQDWRRGVYHLAQLFLDYEPGIHFTQFQMQAGVTGINSIRVYNPIKQSIEKDSEGIFIKKWLPELANINNAFMHEPWKLTPIDWADNPIDEMYRQPVISPKLARSNVVKQLWNLRKNDLVIQESKRLLNIHVRPR
jgi:deoxyribodipyrimidine photo-lyase